jgi:hypothetical protein
MGFHKCVHIKTEDVAGRGRGKIVVRNQNKTVIQKPGVP